MKEETTTQDGVETIQATPYNFRYKIDSRQTVEAITNLLEQFIASEAHGRGRKEIEHNPLTAKVAQWICGDYKPMLLLCGGTGNGKTTTAKAVKSLMESMYVFTATDKDGNRHTIGSDSNEYTESKPQVVMLTATEVSNEARDNIDGFRRIKTARFLIVDDLGLEPAAVKNYGNEISPIAEVLYHRYEAQLFTVMTTNLNREEIGERYGRRIDSRLYEVLDVINVTTKDFRKNNL